MFKQTISLTCLVLVMGSASANAAGPTRPDNSAVNARDANQSTVTPMDQTSGSDADVAMTRLIRKSLIANKDLSTYAHNIKVITLDGKTVLRGPVRTHAERAQVLSIARSVLPAGSQVDNQLTVMK